MTSAALAKPHQKFNVLGVLQDPDTLVEMVDTSGNIIEGVHTGEVRCNGDNNNCRKKTQLNPSADSVEYQFKSLQAFDLVDLRLVVAGTGTIFRDAQKERFLFTAVFTDNRDGTMSVNYVASNPDASFIVPSSPGALTFIGSP